MLPNNSFVYADFLMQLLEFTADKSAVEWLRRKREELSENFTPQKFYTAFAAVPRITGRKVLTVLEEDLQKARLLRRDFTPAHWTSEQVARAVLLLGIPQPDAESYRKVLDRLFETGDLAELTALYKALPLLPFPETHIPRAKEGIRTNMTPVFEALALENPYPADYFDELAWNQMVLKTIFIGKSVRKIIGLKRRANAELARMLCDFARERRAAGRPVPPDLWLPVGEFVNAAIISDLQQILSDCEEPAQRLAVALVCRDSTNPEAQRLLERYPDLQQFIADGLDWADLS